MYGTSNHPTLVGTKTDTYYIIPKDFVAFDTVEVPGVFSPYENGKSEPVTQDVKIRDRQLLQHSDGGIISTISLITLQDREKSVLQTSFHIPVFNFQIALRVDINYPLADFKQYNLEYDPFIREKIVWALILANRNTQIYFVQGESYQRMGGDAQGTILPYSFTQLTGDGFLNGFYGSEYTRTVFQNHYATRFEEEHFDRLGAYLEKLIVNKSQTIKNLTVETFIQSHTSSWIPTGKFYPAVIVIFNCFESILNKRHGQQIADLLSIRPDSDEYDLFIRFQKFRNGVTHIENHHVDYDVNHNQFLCVRFAEQDGTLLATPIQTTLRVGDLERIRLRLIDEIVARL